MSGAPGCAPLRHRPLAMARRRPRLLLLAGLPALAAASWDFHGRLPEWRADFPDSDCRRRGTPGMALWDNLRRRLEASEAEDEWGAIVAATYEQLPFDRAREELDDQRQPQCPFGMLFAAVALYKECMVVEGSQPVCSAEDMQGLSDIAQGIFRATTVEALLGTKWPLLRLLASLRIPPYFQDPELACETIESPVLDWRGLRNAFHPSADWFHDAKPFVYNRAFQAQWLNGISECTYGFAMIALWKLVICAETQAECVSQYSVMVDDLLKSNDWREVSSNRWPMFDFLARVQKGITRHEYSLDFLPSELQGPLAGFPRRPLIASPPGRTVQDVVASALEASGQTPSYAGVLAAALGTVPRSYAAKGPDGRLEVRRLLYITMVFGPRYVAYIPRFASRAAAVGIANLAFFCLDEAAMAACRALPGEDGSGRCIPGTPSILNKFTLPLVFAQLGVDTFWLDFDIFLLRDPTQHVLDIAHRRGVDLLVSGSFADDCICSGLVFFRATQTVVDWLLIVLSWMYEHVYTHDQQAFSAFLAGRPDEDNATTPERISSKKLFLLYLHPEVPRWALLDPVVEFASARVLNTTGWTGEMEDMFIFHFLHGDSEVNRGHSAYGWNAASGFTGGASPTRALLDIFYGDENDAIYVEATRPVFQVSASIRQALLASRRPERPREMLHCGVLQLNPYSPGRMSPDG